MDNTTEFQDRPQPEVNEQASVEQTKKEDAVKVPTSIIRWVCYTAFFMLLLLPFVIHAPLTVWQQFSIAAILGQFAGQINKLIDK